MWPLTASNQSHKIANTFSSTQIFSPINSTKKKHFKTINRLQTNFGRCSFLPVSSWCIKLNAREKEFNPMLRTIKSGTFGFSQEKFNRNSKRLWMWCVCCYFIGLKMRFPTFCFTFFLFEIILMVHFCLQTNQVDLLISCIQMYVLIVLFHNDSINSYWVRCWWLRHSLQAYSFLLLCSNGHVCWYRMFKVLLMSWAIAQFGLCSFALWFFLLAKAIAIINSLPPIYDEILKQVTFLVQRLFFSPQSFSLLRLMIVELAIYVY